MTHEVTVKKDFYSCPLSGNEVYEHHACIGGQRFSARFAVSRAHHKSAVAPDLDYINRHLRDSIGRAVADYIYKVAK